MRSLGKGDRILNATHILNYKIRWQFDQALIRKENTMAIRSNRRQNPLQNFQQFGQTTQNGHKSIQSQFGQKCDHNSVRNTSEFGLFISFRHAIVRPKQSHTSTSPHALMTIPSRKVKTIAMR